MTIIRGSISIFLYGIWSLLLGILFLVATFLIILVPIPAVLKQSKKLLYQFPRWWNNGNDIIMKISCRHKLIVVQSSDYQFNPKGRYLLISNHVSWADILILGAVFHRHLPMLKFFMKKSLLWQLPFMGVGTYLLGFPFVERHSHQAIKKNPRLKGKDILTTRKACQKLRENPAVLVNFVEGTRFTLEKQRRQQSPFRHLLKPKSGGIAVVISEMKDCLDGIINVTINPVPKPLTIWDFASGNFDKIYVNYEVIPLDDRLIGNYEDRHFRASFQEWLNNLWQKKDELLQRECES